MPNVFDDLRILTLQSMVAVMRDYFQSPGLIIAGGAPRDIISNVPVKDIDVFVKMNVDFEKHKPLDDHFRLGCEGVAELYGGALVFRDPPKDYYCMDLAEITRPSGPPIQIIGVHNTEPIDDVPNYDFGLSQVFVTPNGVFFTERAVSDRTYSQITYTPSAEDTKSFERSKARYLRLQAKYAGWVFVGCGQLIDSIDRAALLQSNVERIING